MADDEATGPVEPPELRVVRELRRSVYQGLGGAVAILTLLGGAGLWLANAGAETGRVTTTVEKIGEDLDKVEERVSALEEQKYVSKEDLKESEQRVIEGLKGVESRLRRRIERLEGGR